MEEKKSDLIQLLSVNNLVPLIGTIIAAVVFIFKLQTGNELITYKIDQLNVKLDKLIEERNTSVDRMRTLVDKRAEEVNRLNDRITIVETYLKLP
jgi:hypothetical protein